jgi:hypothetical protein
MSVELQHRHDLTGGTLYFTLRKPNGTAPQWSVSGAAFEAVTAANWANYYIAMAEGAGNYLYSGLLPVVSGNMVAGWYFVEVYEQAGASPAIDDTRVASYFGYWDGTTFKYWGSDTIAVGGTVQTAGDVLGTWTPTKAGYVDQAISAKRAATLAAADVSGNLPADVKAWNGGALPTIPGAAPSAGTIADAVWDEAKSEHTTSDTFGLWLGTKLWKWLGALAGKTADTTTRGEINATTAGAGYDETTDSQEAIRDRGDAAWTDSGGGSNGGIFD